MKRPNKKSFILTSEEFEAAGRQPATDHETIVISSEPTGVSGVLTAVNLSSALALARYEVQIVGQAPADRQETTE